VAAGGLAALDFFLAFPCMVACFAVSRKMARMGKIDRALLRSDLRRGLDGNDAHRHAHLAFRILTENLACHSDHDRQHHAQETYPFDLHPHNLPFGLRHRASATTKIKSYECNIILKISTKKWRNRQPPEHIFGFAGF
jgi:hypothetical protein